MTSIDDYLKLRYQRELIHCTNGPQSTDTIISNLLSHYNLKQDFSPLEKCAVVVVTINNMKQVLAPAVRLHGEW